MSPGIGGVDLKLIAQRSPIARKQSRMDAATCGDEWSSRRVRDGPLSECTPQVHH